MNPAQASFRGDINGLVNTPSRIFGSVPSIFSRFVHFFFFSFFAIFADSYADALCCYCEAFGSHGELEMDSM